MWHWESFLGFTCLRFYLKRYPVYSIKDWEAMSLNLRSLEFRHCCRRRCCRIHCCHWSCCRHRRSLILSARHRQWSPTVARHHQWSPTVARHCRWSHTVTRHRNHSHKKSNLCKWVHWTPIIFQILNLDT